MREIIRYFIRLSYDGTGFHGWQRQPNGITVQQTLEEAMSLVLRTPITLTGAGRTDTGVHAAVFYAHCDLEFGTDQPTLDRLVHKLNSFIGPGIAIDRIFPVNPNAHARFSAVSRTYRYTISRAKDPFIRNYSWFVFGNLDVDMMNQGARILMQYDDFTSFSKVDTDTKTNICRVSQARWESEGKTLLFTITADRFLRNMVRSVVGTLLDIGKQRITTSDLVRIIERKDRRAAGESAPARGLMLTGIEYPDWVFRNDGIDAFSVGDPMK